VKKLDDVKNLKLIVAGASFYGKDVSESPYMVELKKEAETVREKVIFTGYVDYRKMPSYLKTADIAVVPSLWEEPFGLTDLEAMASGVPLITTRSGGIPEICEGVAILLDRDDICHHLAEAIRFLYNHPVEAKVLSQKAQTRSWDFDKDVFSRNYMSILEMIQK
jgi:glycosyltransferase involved in cell wall biosynthesis